VNALRLAVGTDTVPRMTAAGQPGGQPLGDGIVSEEKLRMLLSLGIELNELDFKEYLDLSS
jgi:hypothetical protein